MPSETGNRASGSACGCFCAADASSRGDPRPWPEVFIQSERRDGIEMSAFCRPACHEGRPSVRLGFRDMWSGSSTQRCGPAGQDRPIGSSHPTQLHGIAICSVGDHVRLDAAARVPARCGRWFAPLRWLRGQLARLWSLRLRASRERPCLPLFANCHTPNVTVGGET